MTFAKFWPIYLAEHRSGRNRALHLAGTIGYLLLLATLLIAGRSRWIWTVPLLAYGCAWTGHFIIEKNRPATFSHPWLSLIGDHKMAALILAGRINAEFERLGIKQKS